MTCAVEKKLDDTPMFFFTSFVNVILWISLWGILYFAIEIISKKNKSVELMIYAFMLLFVLVIKCYFPQLVNY